MKASKELSANLWTAVVALACLVLVPSAALGFATMSAVDPSGFSDLWTNPNDYPSWDLTDITYSFDSSFDEYWPNPLVKDQVRLAFRQWDTAYAQPYGAVDSYKRTSGYKPFGDIRSIALHEIGHVLGLHHPNEAADLDPNRNWLPYNDDWLRPGPDQDNEVMRQGIQPGDYNHVLSHDELDAFRYMYGRDLNFTETTGTGDIVISAYTAGANNWAYGGGRHWQRTPGDWSQGTRVTDGFIKFNKFSDITIGLKTLGISWDYQNVGDLPTFKFIVRTTGTNNPDPLSHDSGPGQFDYFNTWPEGVDPRDPQPEGEDHKDDVSYVWRTSPSGTIPAADVIHVGMEQDVWDWSVLSAAVVHLDLSTTAAPLLTMQQWNNTIVRGTPAAAGGPSGTSDMGPETEVIARGIRIVASDIATLVSDLRLARVDGMDVGLDDLNSTMLGVLTKMQMVEVVEDFGDQTLAPGSDFIIVFEGTDEDLPNDVQKGGNFMILDRPEYLDQELFVFARSRALEGAGVVGTYALLGTAPIVPEPATLALLGLGAAGLVARRRRK